jgi:hypothetical protein
MRSMLRTTTVFLLMGSMVGVAIGLAGSAPGLGIKAAAASPSVSSGSQTPAFDGDAADPNVLFYNGTYYAFTTGTALGNNLQALIDTGSSPRASRTDRLRCPSLRLGRRATRRPHQVSSATAVIG